MTKRWVCQVKNLFAEMEKKLKEELEKKTKPHP